jgi:hypothetical protein
MRHENPSPMFLKHQRGYGRLEVIGRFIWSTCVRGKRYFSYRYFIFASQKFLSRGSHGHALKHWLRHVINARTGRKQPAKQASIHSQARRHQRANANSKSTSRATARNQSYEAGNGTSQASKRLQQVMEFRKSKNFKRPRQGAKQMSRAVQAKQRQ